MKNKCWWQIAPTNYFWDFGDGQSDGGLNITHLYDHNGLYEVQMIAANVYGRDTINKTLEINHLPEAAFSVSDTIVTLPNATVQFTSLSSNADSLFWIFGDGNIGYATNPSHTYAFSYQFLVRLIAYSVSGCSDTASMVVEVRDYNYASNDAVSGACARITPNPSSGQFTVQLAGSIEGLFSRLEVFDMLGKPVYSCPLNQNETAVNIENFVAGIYFYRVISDRGIVGRGKIVVE
ncbi:MAG: PKD domain-containing protein [Bacteroidetes bacterium]|nr:PKD domain-containing protein [Bacteroidota bacterium]MBU1717771.1 PKD domain-containing protein [Bacteroidota bacterium]